MARWKLMVARYLNVPGEEWEYKEQSRTTGKEVRVRIPVPTLLDPRDPACWTNRWGFKDNQEGEVIVCYEGKGESTDKVFTGNPRARNMVPLDDEAKAISAGFAGLWAFKPETDSGNYSQSLIDKFQLEAAEKAAKPAQIEGLSELVAAINGLVKQNAELNTSRRI